MSNWKHYNLIDVADVKLSNVDKKTKTNERTVHLCNYTDVYKNHFINKVLTNNFMIATCSENDYKKFNLKEGQVAITKDSEKADDIGVSTFISESLPNVVLGYHLSLITPNKDQLDGRFLHFWFNTKHAKRYFENNASGSGQRYSLNLDTIKSIPLLLPEISVQQQIAKVLSDLDAKIEVNNLIHRELEAMAKLVYDYWFVQFDFPNKDGKPYKSSGGKMVYNEALKREIPEGWKRGTLDNISQIIRGVSYNKTDIKTQNDKNTIPILRATNISGNIIDLNNMVYVPNEFVVDIQIMKKYDILITMSSGSIDHIGKNGMYYFEEKVAFGAFCAKLVAKDEFQFFLSSYLQSEYVAETIKNECLGTNINNLNGTIVKGFKLIIPKIEVIKKYNKILKPIHDKIGMNFNENQQLTRLRDWLLPMLMNGQATVGKAYKEGSEEMGMAAEGGEVYVIPLYPEKEENHFVKRKMMASYIINQSLDDPSFGDVKFEKLLYLTDYHAIQRNLGQKYKQNAAGPYDNSFTYPFFQQVLNAKWFTKEKLGNLNRIKAGENQSKSVKMYGYFSEAELNRINEIIGYFKDTNYEKPEIVATLYAVWNNRIIKKQPVTDELLKEDFLNWDQQKVKYKTRLDGALEWMRKVELIPTGWGEVIERKSK